MSPTTNDTSDRSGCDREALHAYAVGLLDPEQEQPLLDHLQACAACRKDLAWIGQVDQMLGFTPEGHPSSADLVDYASGGLAAARRNELAAHFSSCASCTELVETARLGLADLERLEQSEQVVASGNSWTNNLLSSLALIMAVPPPPMAMALAKDGAQAAPVPEDRRVVHDEPGVFRLVYWREAGHGRLALFTERPGAPEVLACTLDETPLDPTSGEEGLVFALGPVEDLFGRALSLTLRLDGVERVFSFSLVEE